LYQFIRKNTQRPLYVFSFAFFTVFLYFFLFSAGSTVFPRKFEQGEEEDAAVSAS
jgi:hypothetical protein